MPAGVVEMADLAGAVVQVVVVDGAFVEACEVLGAEAAGGGGGAVAATQQDHEARIQAQHIGDGILVLPCRLGFLDDGLALELGEAEVRDGVAERRFVVALVQGDGVAVRVVRGGGGFAGDAVDETVDGRGEQGRGFGRIGQETLGDEGVVGLLREGHLGVQLLFERLDQLSICQFQVHPVVVTLFKDTKKSYICIINPYPR